MSEFSKALNREVRMSAPITAWPENMVRFARQTIENREVGEAIQRAARDLPEGYSLQVYVENGYGFAQVTTPQETTSDASEPGAPMSKQIADALQYAQEHAKQNTQVTP